MAIKCLKYSRSHLDPVYIASLKLFRFLLVKTPQTPTAFFVFYSLITSYIRHWFTAEDNMKGYTHSHLVDLHSRICLRSRPPEHRHFFLRQLPTAVSSRDTVCHIKISITWLSRVESVLCFTPSASYWLKYHVGIILLLNHRMSKNVALNQFVNSFGFTTISQEFKLFNLQAEKQIKK